MGNHPTKHNKVRPKKNVHWKSAEPPAAPGRPILIPGTEDAPDVVTIRWERPQYDGGSPIIGYVVEHRRMGSTQWVKATPLLVPYLELSLGGLEPGWRYQFRIVAENAVGKSEPSELSDPLAVTLQRNAVTAPHFTTELRDTTAIENEKIEFKVNVIGTPPPQVSWFKDGFEIFSSRRTKITVDNTSSSLVIHQAALADEGEIKCTATNRSGYVVSRAKLAIEALPKVRLPRQYEDGLIIEADEIIRLKVGTAGRPEPQIIWLHNGEIVKNDDRHEITAADKHTSLKIANTQRADRGEYQIKAINKLGVDSASFLVTVTAKPQPPGKVSITMSLGKTVSLVWTAPTDDGGCKIGNYIVEYFRQGWNVWLKAATTRQLTATLNDLIEGSDYKFRVKAENPYGLSEPSEESDTITIPGPKRDPTVNIYEIENDSKDTTPKVAPRKKRDQSHSPHRLQKSAHIVPALFDSENIENELSYGASDALYKARDPPPIVKISPPKKVPNSGSTPGIKRNVSFERQFEKREESNINLSTQRSEAEENVHNSSEFVLVLYPDNKSEKNKEHSSSFDLSIENSIAPPLSLSAPDLSIEPPPPPTMRHSVSSTELLYERAMSRLYQAIAFEESEKVKKITPQENNNNDDYSNIHNEEAAVDPLLIHNQKLSKYEEALNSTESYENNEIQDEEYAEEGVEEEEEEDVDKDYDEDYTASTASSDESETEKFKRAVQSANLKPQLSDELDTYHPRNMEPRTVTTYRSNDPNQAIEVLTRPLPLPNPDFVPKPILKRPKPNEGDNKSTKPTKANKTKTKKGRILKQLFDREKKKNEEKAPPPKPEEDSKKTIDNARLAKIAEEQKKLAILRQDSIEESKVVIDHYSDIVRERGVNRKSSLPIYLDPQQLKLAADEEDEMVEQEELNTPEDNKQFFSASPLLQRKYSKPDVFIPPSPPPLEPSYNVNPRISRKLSTDKTIDAHTASSQERKPRGQTISKDRTRSRSNSGIRQRSTAGQHNGPSPSNNTSYPSSRTTTPSPGPRIRSRNTSQSPVVKNRMRFENHKAPSSNHVSPSPSPNQIKPLEISQIETHEKVKSQMAYLTDLGLFFAACWLYFFKDARLALPVILLIVYRQLSDAVKERLPHWVTGNKS